MKLNAIIVEDEQISRDILKNYIAKYCKDVSVLNEATNVDEAFKILEHTEVDLVFLDVEMPFGTAFDLLDKLIKMRQENAKYISSRILKFSQIMIPNVPDGYEHTYQMYTIRLKNKKIRE